MRKVFSWLAVTLVISALTTAAVANYVQNHPTCVLAQWAGRAAALCTAAPTAAEQPASSAPAMICMDGVPLPDALVDLSPELKSACSYDLSELRAIADMGQKTGPRVVCAVPEDEFTYPALPKPHERLVVVADGIVTEFINDYPTPMPVTSEPRPEPLPMPEPSFDIEFDFAVTGKPGIAFDFALPMLPGGNAPCVGVFNVVKEMIGACVKGLAEDCPCEKAKAGKQALEPTPDATPPWVEARVPSKDERRAMERGPIIPPCQACVQRHLGPDGLERIGIDFDCPPCPEQGCDDCHLDLKNVLIVVAPPGQPMGPQPVYVQYLCGPESECECCKDCKCGKACACGKTKCTKGCVCTPTLACPPFGAPQGPVQEAGCWVQQIRGPVAPMCVPLPPGCPVNFAQVCPMSASCCQQTKLVRKVYPVGCFIDWSQAATEEDVMRVICRTVSPETWEEAGGRGVVDYFPLTKSLVVLQSAEVHDEIDLLLNELRGTMGAPSHAQTACVPAQFATFVTEGVLQVVATTCQEPCCPKECSACACCQEACCKASCITIEVSDPDCYLDVWEDANGQAHVSCKGLKLCMPLNGACCVRIVRGACCAAGDEACRAWYECGDEVEFVPYVPADEAAFEFEALLREVDNDRGGSILVQLSTPEDLPVFVEPAAGRFHDPSQDCPLTGRCTRCPDGSSVIRRVIHLIPGQGVGTSGRFGENVVWQTVLAFQESEGTGENDHVLIVVSD